MIRVDKAQARQRVSSVAGSGEGKKSTWRKKTRTKLWSCPVKVQNKQCRNVQVNITKHKKQTNQKMF